MTPGTYDSDDDLMAMARDEGRPAMRVSVCPETAVVLGRGSRMEDEVRLHTIQADGVPLLRRPGGGCSVVLDPGNLVVSVALPLPGVLGIQAAFQRISRWLTAGLEDAGVPDVRRRDVSDLVLGERKVGGACVYRAKGLLYYSTTLLVAPDLDRVERYLHHPPREPEYRRGRNHRDFMGRLADLAGVSGPGPLAARLEETLSLDDLP